jgi:type II secretory pathway component PulJ
MHRSNKVTGFTLVELIIVMATFSIIMFGALQLLDPSRRMWTRSYSNESMISGATQINNYLENTLRFASFVSISDSAPTATERQTFIASAFNDKLNVVDADHVSPATGNLYIIEIDNEHGGKIRKWDYTYTAGGRFDEDDTVTDPSVLPTTDPSIGTATDCINEAIYNDFNYNISLGAFETATESVSADTDTLTIYKLVRNDSYYEYYNGTMYQSFGLNNFGFTITAYPNRMTNAERAKYEKASITATRYDGGDGSKRYTNASFFASSIRFDNMNTDISYPIYKRDASGNKEKDGTKDKFESFNVANGKIKLPDGKDGGDFTRFSCTFTDAEAEPDHIFIMYAYNDNEVVK